MIFGENITMTLGEFLNLTRLNDTDRITVTYEGNPFNWIPNVYCARNSYSDFHKADLIIDNAEEVDGVIVVNVSYHIDEDEMYYFDIRNTCSEGATCGYIKLPYWKAEMICNATNPKNWSVVEEEDTYTGRTYIDILNPIRVETFEKFYKKREEESY